MTIKQVANQYNISVQAVYKKIKAAGLALDALKDKETGELTPEGEETVLSLFNQSTQVENAVIEGLKAQVNQLTTEVEYLRNALLQAQQLQGMLLQRQALPAPRGGWLSRILGRGKKE